MKSFYHFLRLTRFINLLVIGLCMCVVQIFVSKFIFFQTECYTCFSLAENIPGFLWNMDFILLVVSTLLIAAAGNIINDYFDVKADRVNRPESLIVDKHIKRRWAMFLHWSFNSLGILIGAYLSWKTGNWFIVVISFISINLLWFYSAVFKRKFLSGNLMIAFLTALVPFQVLVYNLFELACWRTLGVFIDNSGFIFFIVVAISGISFFINLIREFVKDVADIRGDLHLGAKTLPIVLGIKKTKIITVVMATVLVSGSLWYGYDAGGHIWPEQRLRYLFLGTVGLSICCIGLSLLIFIRANQRKKYLLASNILKLAMLFGLISPLFL